MEDTIDQIEVDYKQYEESHKGIPHGKTNFLFLFLRNLAQAQKQDVGIESRGTAIDKINSATTGAEIKATIGGAELGHLRFEEVSANVPHLQFTEFRTLPGLEKMGLGSYIFYDFCQRINEKRPGYGLIAWSVKKGRDGSHAYSAWGGYPIPRIRSTGDQRKF